VNKEPLDANSQKTMRKTQNNLYTERGVKWKKNINCAIDIPNMSL